MGVHPSLVFEENAMRLLLIILVLVLLFGGGGFYVHNAGIFGPYGGPGIGLGGIIVIIVVVILLSGE
jgi:hypothetical protein